MARLQAFFHRPTLQQMAIGLLSLAVIWGSAMASSFAAENGLLLLNIDESAAGSAAKQVQAKVMIDAPPDLVWKTITDYADIQHILPGYQKSKVMRSAGANKWLDLAVKVAPFLPTYKYQVQVREDESAYKLNLNRVSGDFKALSATYKLIPQNNGSRTLLMYTLTIDPGFNMPGSQSIIRNNTQKTLAALERYTEQEARKSLIGQR